MTANPDVDFLRHHDWAEITCQCPCHPCDGRARYVVAIHALHACNQPGLDPFGNRIELRCGHCVARLHLDVATKLGRLVRPGQCDGCGAPVREVDDVIRSVSELR